MKKEKTPVRIKKTFIEVNDSYRIEVQSDCWSIQKSAKIKDEIVWKDIPCYCTSLSHCVNRLADLLAKDGFKKRGRKVKVSENRDDFFVTLEEVKNEYKRTRKFVKKLLEISKD